MNISRERAKLRKMIRDNDPHITVKYYHLTREIQLAKDEFLIPGEKLIQPYATIALVKLVGCTTNIARGISICSDADNPDRKNGCERALKRALTAIITGLDQNEIRNKKQASVTRFIHDWNMFSFRNASSPPKSCCGPYLIAFEEKLLFKEEKEVVTS